MKSRITFAFAVLLSAFGPALLAADDAKQPAKKGGQHAGLEQFKKLAGDWVGKGKHGEEEHDVTVNYKVTSAGSAVVETIGAGTDHEMVTVIHPDGKDLVLTHYCALGNQPRMRCVGNGDGKMIAFKFADGTNLKADKDPHMHSVTFTFVDADTLKAEWSFYADGKEASTATFNMKRKK
jgi:hypothetical protein